MGFMNIQEIAYKLLQELGKPMKPEELARIALDRGLITSNSKDAVFSLQSTLRKNIRDEVYNHPKLVTIYLQGERGMHVALPSWQEKGVELKNGAGPAVPSTERKVQLPCDLIKQIELVTQAGITKSFDEALVHLLRTGWVAVRPQVQEELNKFLSDQSNYDNHPTTQPCR